MIFTTLKERLIDIITSVSKPMMMDDVQIREYRTPYWMAEILADALIEHGIMLPTFKIGDIVWVYDFMWGIIPCEVDRPYHCRCGNEGGCTFEMSFEEKDIDVYVFATKEEAEAKWHAEKEE